MFRDTIELITQATSPDEIGQEIPTDSYTEIFAEKNGIQRTEFFNAGQSGIKPALMFKIREIDYNEAESLRYNEKIYTIYRVYPVKSEMLELYCEVRANGN